MKKTLACLLLLALAGPGWATTVSFQDLNIEVPDNWDLKQKAKDGDTVLLGFGQDSRYVTLYATTRSIDFTATFSNGVSVTGESHISANGIGWDVIQTRKDRDDGAVYVYGVKTVQKNMTYYGYAKASTPEDARDAAKIFLDSIQ